LVDSQGTVLGITTTGLVSGVALAIPVSIATSIAEILAQQGYIKRGYLGISSQQVQLPPSQRAGRTQEQGLLIVKVDDDSPEELRVLLSSNRVGKTIPVEVIRGGKLQTLQVTVGQRS
jgi:S1-C subfamily serine protease